MICMINTIIYIDGVLYWLKYNFLGRERVADGGPAIMALGQHECCHSVAIAVPMSVQR